MKIAPAVLLSGVAVLATAVGATAANFAVLSDRSSLHGESHIGGLAPAAHESRHQAEPHSTDGAHTPLPTSTSGAVTPGHHTSGNAHPVSTEDPKLVDPVPTTHDDDDGISHGQDDGITDPIAVPTTNKPVVTIKPLPTHTKKKHRHESAKPKPSKTEDAEDESDDEQEDDEDDD